MINSRKLEDLHPQVEMQLIFKVHCRFQTDASAAAGYHVGMPNTDQAQGFEYGKH
jgi:hypothetical protein